MKPNRSTRYAVLTSMLLASTATSQAGDNQTSLFDRYDGQEGPSNHIGLSYRPGFNMTSRFKNLGGFNAMSNPGPATGGKMDRFYDDGYNRVDISGNAGNQTWFWGYQNPSQIQGAPASGTVVMHSSSSAANITSDANDGDIQHGFEFTYNRQLGYKGHFYWGVEGGLGYAPLSIHDNQPLTGSVTTISDSYSRGIIAPTAPYNGNFTGPGPVIGDTPTRSVGTTPGGALITGERTLDADVVSMRLGPYLQVPLAKRLSASLSGGLALLYVNSDFKFQQNVTIQGLGTQSISGSGSHSDVLAGGYVSANLSFAVTQSVDIFAGAQYMNVGNYFHTENGKRAEIDFSNSVFVTFGVGYSF